MSATALEHAYRCSTDKAWFCQQTGYTPAPRLTERAVVRHPAYGLGHVVRLPRSLLGDVLVEFTIRRHAQRREVQPRDLTVVAVERATA